MAESSPRWATADDDAALRELCTRTPIRGPVSYTLEREPQFFALTNIQGDEGGRVAVITDPNAGIVAMAMVAPMRAWIGGHVQRSAYIGDLKVHPEYRNAGLAGRILRFIGDELQRQEIDVSSFLVLAGNPMLQMMKHDDAQFGAFKLRAIRNFLLLFGSTLGRTGDVNVSGASTQSLPEMIELWNRVNGRRSFAPVLDEKLFARWLSSSLMFDDFRVARREGRVVGFCAVWDASSMKQIRVLQLSPALSFSTAFYNLLARPLGRQRFPRPGQQLRFLYVAHACAERSEDLESLLASIHDECRQAGYLYMDLALDRGDPLIGAVRRFRSMKLDFELWEARTPGPLSGTRSVPIEVSAYFDMSLV